MKFSFGCYWISDGISHAMSACSHLKEVFRKFFMLWSHYSAGGVELACRPLYRGQQIFCSLAVLVHFKPEMVCFILILDVAVRH